MNPFIKAVAGAVIFFAPLSLAALEEAGRQVIDVTIASDFSARGTWAVSLPLDRVSRQFYVPEFVAYGNAVSTRYKLTNVQTPWAPASLPFAQVQDEVIGISKPAMNDAVMQSFKLSYSLTPYFKQPVAVYEIWVAPGVSQVNPLINITYPSSWKLMTSWPTVASSSVGVLHIDYPPTQTSPEPVIVVFQTNSGGVVRQSGKYTVSGAVEDVQKIIDALGKIQSVDQTLQNSVGIQSPSEVLIVAENLSTVGQIGYEAEAIAAKPNIIVFNNQLTKSKTTSEIAEVMSHELLHLAMEGTIRFQNRPYYAPFMNEGIAVYFQGLMHRSIFIDPTERILNEELDRTHMVSPSEASVLYEGGFDADFDGSRKLGTPASYKHAGLIFSRFADVSGQDGFKKFWPQIANAKSSIGYGNDSDTVLNILSAISGLSVDKLKFPGKSEGDIPGIVGRISHPENDPEKSAEIVTNYIKTGIKHYFAAGAASAAAPTPIPQNSVSAAVPNAVKLTKNLAVGSTGAEVIALQSFLQSKGFLTMPPGIAMGSFGKVTRSALVVYQKSIGVAQTGTLGPKTRSRINAENGF